MMKCYILHNVCGVFAPLTPVAAVPADVAVTLLHVPIQTIVFQTWIVAMGTVEMPSPDP